MVRDDTQIWGSFPELPGDRKSVELTQDRPIGPLARSRSIKIVGFWISHIPTYLPLVYIVLARTIRLGADYRGPIADKVLLSIHSAHMIGRQGWVSYRYLSTYLVVFKDTCLDVGSTYGTLERTLFGFSLGWGKSLHQANSLSGIMA